jgi:type IV pilus assembly protein PilQ
MKKGFFLILLLSLFGSFQVGAQEITNVNFVQEGEVSKLIIETSGDAFAERFHVTEDKQIILDIKNTKVSPKLLRGIDTSEFPGSTVFISGYKKPGSTNDVRFAIQLRDNVRSTLENKTNKIVLNIENRFGAFSQSKIRASEPSNGNAALVEDAIGFAVPKSNSIEDILANLTMSGPKKYIGKRISINVRDIPIPDLLNMIADTSGFNIIIDQGISSLPPLTLTLTNVPWDQALDTIMNLSKLVAQKSSNILIMKTLATATKEKEDEVKAIALKEGLEPLVTRIFLINYASLPDISKIVKDYMTPTRSTLQADDRTNSLIVKDTVESIERIKKIIETLDTQTPQILIEAKIVEATESYSKRFGLERGVTFGYDPVSLPQNPTGPGFSFSSAPNAVSPTVAGMTVGVYKRLLNLNFNLQLMESESKGRIISTPRIVTQNKKAATITSTEQTSFRVQQPATGQSPALATFQNVSAALSLNVTPQVTNDGAIAMQITLGKSSFGDRPTPDAPPNTSTKNVTTNVLVDNGSTVVIGGVYSNENSETHSGVPYLKDLPLVGWLFRTPFAPITRKSELIIFMTPRIMNQEEAGFSERSSAKTGVSETQL